MSLVWAPVTPRVFVTTVEPDRVNVGLVVGDDEALLIDTGNTPEQGAELVASAEALTGVPVRRAVLTHDHADHVGGLAGMPAVEGIAHENVTSVTPARTYSLALALNVGGQRVELLHLGSAHTRSDTIVFVPGENVIFTGDLLEEGADPQIDDDTSLANWPTVLDGVLGACNAGTRFVPGHGAVVDRDFAFVQRAEVAMLYSQSEYLIGQGVALADAAAATEWPFTAETLAVALPKAYAELAAQGVEPKRQLPIFGL